MALVPLLGPDEAAEPDRAALASGLEQYGQTLHTWGAILNKPGLFGAYLPFLRQVAGPGSLDPALKDMSAVLVGHLNHCRYTVSHRYASSRRNGVTDGQLRDVVAGRWDGFGRPLVVALEFTRALTLQPAAVPFAQAPQAVDAAILEALHAEFTDEQVVELSMSVSVWNALARFHRVMGFDLDMPPAPEGIDPLGT